MPFSLRTLMVFLLLLAMAVSAFAAPKKCRQWLNAAQALVLPQENKVPVEADSPTSAFPCASSAVVASDRQEDTAFLPIYITFCQNGAAEPVFPGYRGLPYAPPRVNALL